MQGNPGKSTLRRISRISAKGDIEMIMALAPGEVFSHTHQHPSVTMLVQGEAALEVDGTSMPLVQGRAMEIGPNVKHVVVNLGSMTAMVRCFHIVVES